MYTILLLKFRKHGQFGNTSCRDRLHGSLEMFNLDLLELLNDDDYYNKNDVRKSRTAYILYIYTRTHILMRKSRMSFFNVFCFLESVLVYDINNVRLNKWSFLYLVGILFLELFNCYLLLKSFPLTWFGQNSADMYV